MSQRIRFKKSGFDGFADHIGFIRLNLMRTDYTIAVLQALCMELVLLLPVSSPENKKTSLYSSNSVLSVFYCLRMQNISNVARVTG